jgi:hypothetical protein
MSSKAEEDFVEQFARVLLLSWCCQTLADGCVADIQDAGGYRVPERVAKLCFEHAQEAGWVGKSSPKKVLAKGFSTAAAFLRR